MGYLTSVYIFAGSKFPNLDVIGNVDSSIKLSDGINELRKSFYN